MFLLDKLCAWIQRRRTVARMWQAARRGDRAMILQLMDTEFDVATLGDYCPLMMYAACWNDQDLAQRLIEKRVSLKHHWNCWVLYCAVKHRNLALVEWATAAGLDVNRGPRRVLSPLELAVSNNDVEGVEVLLRCGAVERSLRYVRWHAVTPDVARVLARHGFKVSPVAFEEFRREST